MILWFVLFGLVVLISFVLALLSMREYHEIPKESDYGLFLIRKPTELTGKFLDSIQRILDSKVLSIERLIKGDQSVLVMFGPRSLLLENKDLLDLVELEDYTRIGSRNVSCYEVGNSEKMFTNLPKLLHSEQFWCQFLLSSKADGVYFCQTRIAVVADTERRRVITEKFLKIPKTFSNEQMLDFYKKRIFRNDSGNASLKSSEMAELFRL